MNVILYFKQIQHFILLIAFFLTLFLSITATYARQSSPNPLANKLTVSDSASFSYFGTAVSADDNRLLIGASENNGRDFKSGSAYIFSQQAESWQQEQKLIADDGQENDQFGFAVALSGELALIGAYRNDEQATDSGAAYLYQFDGATWQQRQKLVPTHHAETSEEWFGYHVAIDGDVLLIGAPNAEGGKGAAYIFRQNEGTWQQEARISASDARINDQFAYSVALHDGVALIGTPQQDKQALDRGAAYVYRFNGSTWQEEQKLQANDGAMGDHFGNAVALSSHLAVIGAKFDNTAQRHAGSVYIFRWNGDQWQEEQKLSASDKVQNSEFGYSLSLSEEQLLIGAPGDDDHGAESGSVYLYQWDGTGWQETQKISSKDSAARDHFGYSVSLDNRLAFIGAPDHLSSRGAVYFDQISLYWSIRGQVKLESRHAKAHSGSSIRVENAQGDSFETLAAPDGTFRLNQIPPGTYQLTQKHDNFLSYSQELTLNQNIIVSCIALRAGDIDDNGIINRQDEQLMLAGIIPVSLPNYDLNADGTTDVADLFILQRNIGKSSSDNCKSN